MAQDDDRYLAVHLEKCGLGSMPGVLQLLRDSKIADVCYAYKMRTKPEAQLIEKVARKKPEKPDYTLSSITDVVGLRLVALFRSEMVDLYEAMLLAITHMNGLSPNPFLRGKPEEVILYKGTSAFDELLPRLKDVTARVCPGLVIVEKNSREGYSSIHLVTRLQAVPEKLPSAGYMLPAEIQIRTVFEDAWGEIDHKYGYVKRSGKNTGRPVNNPEFVLSHLKVLKRFSDACMEYADAIRSEAIGYVPIAGGTQKVRSVESDEYILKRFKELGVQEDIIEKYSAASSLKVAAEGIGSGQKDRQKEAYLIAAEAFRELGEILDADRKQDADDKGKKLAYYFTRMSEALCLMATNERDQIVAAQYIYANLEALFPDFPLLHMRYGQALGKLGQLDEALNRLRAAGEAARTIAKDHLGKGEGHWPDNLHLTDYQHIIRNQPKLLGYNLWLKIRTPGLADEMEKFDLYREAYEVTRVGLEAVADDPTQALRMHNNLLYYALGQLCRLPAKTGQEDKVTAGLKSLALEHVNQIGKLAPNPAIMSVAEVDTMMKAFSFLDQRREAVAMAELLTERCLGDTIEDSGSEQILELVRDARRVIKGEAIRLIE